MAVKAAYGSNPHAGINPNDDHGWGGHQWPGGVPGNLLAVVTVPGNVRIVVRKELAELVGLNYQIAQVKYGRNFSRGWTGGYENRAIAGTNTPSNHSKGKAIDNDASVNPMSYIFQSDIPPELVTDWESTGWYWGGRYTGRTDTMHFEYCYAPSDVAGHVARARAILAAAGAPTPSPPAPAPAPQAAPAAPAPAPAPAPVDHPYHGRVLTLTSPRLAGNDVMELQKRLTDHLVGSHIPGIDADGIFGPKTDTAVRWYQTCRHGPPFNLDIDGDVGPMTWASLWR